MLIKRPIVLCKQKNIECIQKSLQYEKYPFYTYLDIFQLIISLQCLHFNSKF